MLSTAEYQRAEFLHQSILLIRVVVGKILLQFLEEFLFAVFLAFQAEADERGDRLAHTGVNRLGEPLHFVSEWGGQSDRITRLAFAPEMLLPRQKPPWGR